MGKTVTIDAVHKLVEYKTGKSIKRESNIGGWLGFIAFFDAEVKISDLYCDEELELVALDENDMNISKSVRCMLVDGDLTNGELSVTEALNGYW